MATDQDHGPVPLTSPATSGSGKGRPPPGFQNSSISPTSAGKKRTSHACDRCRLMRTKCTGGTRCSRCIRDDAQCVYGDHKRERNKKDLVETSNRARELEAENRRLLAALRQLATAPNFVPSEHANVVELLASQPGEDRTERSSFDSRSRSRSLKSPNAVMDGKMEMSGEMSAPSTIGSPGKQGEVREVMDSNHGSGATGFIGKLSEMSWMQRCREYLHELTDSHLDENDRDMVNERAIIVMDTVYFMDDLDLLAVDEDYIQPMQWPPFEVAVVLSEAFFHSMQGAFDFVSRDAFLETLYAFPQSPLPITWTQRRWLAVANLVWAIGAKWLNLAQLDGPEFPENHLVFYARARALGLDHRVSFDHPGIGMVQGMGLLAFYLLINGSISRAWNATSNAVQHAVSLGLHLKTSDPSTSNDQRRTRSRTWFSLYKLQILLVEITGRPPFMRSSHATADLDLLPSSAYDQGNTRPTVTTVQVSTEATRLWSDFLHTRSTRNLLAATPSVPSQIFMYHARLCQLSEEAADQLFTPGHEIRDVSWQHVQTKIKRLQASFEAWNKALPGAWKIDDSSQQQHHPDPRSGLHLALYASSVSMMINRPCLCEIVIDNESEESKRFNMSSARNCIRSAISMLDILPDGLSRDGVYQLLPWWTLLHYLCQAISVLLIELCLRVQHFQGETAQILRAVRKGMDSLASMTQESMSAFKAWRICIDLIRRINTLYRGTEMFDLTQGAVQPAGWSADDEEELLASLG